MQKKKQRRRELYKIYSKNFLQTSCRITSIEIPVDTGDFRIIDHKIVDVLKQ